MKNVRLGRTEIIVPQNAFGCLPIQRDTKEVAVKLLREAYEGGMRFFDTARAYTDSEEKVGEAFDGMRGKIYIATKTAAKTPEGFWKDLETSLKNLRTDYIDIYQLHMVPQCYRPGDGTGMYECLVQAKEKGLIHHIGITTHKLAGEFCRGCGYCLPCPMGIEINNCARMSLMVRRAPSASWLSESWQEKMAKIETCINCRQCTKRCPYELDTPELLRKNLADYKRILAGEVSV